MSQDHPGPNDAAGTEHTRRLSAERPGPDLARTALDAARQAARKQERSGAARWRRVAGRSRPGWTGSGADPRDPQLVGALITGMVRDRGWERRSAEATVIGRWEQLVGPGIAAHSTAVSLREGALTVTAESTAWATQLRLLTPRILQKLRTEVGADIVTSVRVNGPTAPSWQRGRRSVQWRGPRDTYG